MWLKVMISYSHKDKQIADVLVRQLRSVGVEAWIDNRIPVGVEWSEDIEIHIKDAMVVVLLLSSSSVKSAYVHREFNYARRLGKKIVPIKIEDEVEDIPNDWASIQYMVWDSSESISQIIIAFGNQQKYHEIYSLGIWVYVRQALAIEFPQTSNIVTQITPLYVNDKMLVVQVPNATSIFENEERICRTIEQTLARYGLQYKVLLKFPGNIFD